MWDFPGQLLDVERSTSRFSRGEMTLHESESATNMTYEYRCWAMGQRRSEIGNGTSLESGEEVVVMMTTRLDAYGVGECRSAMTLSDSPSELNGTVRIRRAESKMTSKMWKMQT